jgi:hypothetical protein
VARGLNKPLIVTAELGRADFAWLNDLRRRHYPPEHNRLPAHLTIFRTLPPSAESEIMQILRTLSATPAPAATVAGLMDLGGGVALRIVSTELDLLRSELVDRLHGLLTPQDSSGWTPHVTIQNKVEPRTARELMRELGNRDVGKPLRIAGLGLHRYLGGEWERVRIFPFRT